MALRCKLRSLTLQRHRLFSTSTVPRNSRAGKERSRTALSLIRFEQNPSRILDICRSAALNPETKLGRIAYSSAIFKLKESNHHESIRDLIKESIKQFDVISERIVSHFIVMYGQGGLVDDAFKLFDEMPALGVERSVKTLNSLLFSCILGREYGELKRVFLEFPRKYGLEPNLETYNTALKGFCESGSSNTAYSILAKMEKKCMQPNARTFATAIAGFYREENYIDVGKMLMLMNRYGIEPGIGIYNDRILNLCKLRRSSEAKALLDGILSKGRGMKPNSATYGHLIYGFCREGKFDIAISLLKEMVEKRLKPEAECYFTLVYYLCQGGEFEAALRICKECMSKGWVPNISSMKSLVDGLISIGKVDEAREIIRQVKEKFSRNADSWGEIEEGLPE